MPLNSKLLLARNDINDRAEKPKHSAFGSVDGDLGSVI